MYILEFELGKLYVSISEIGIEKLAINPVEDGHEKTTKTNAIFYKLNTQLHEHFRKT